LVAASNARFKKIERRILIIREHLNSLSSILG